MPTEAPAPAAVGCAAFQLSSVAHAQLTALDAAGDDAALVELVDVLHPHPERHSAGRHGLRQGVQRLEQRRARVPGHGLRSGAQIVALARGHRHVRDVARGDADRIEVGRDFAAQLVEALLAIAGEVHLVDRHHDAAHAQQAQQVGVAPRLVLHPFVRVDDQHHRVGAGRPAHHVLQEFLVPRGIDQHVFALPGAKADLRGIDGDPLVALGLHGVDDECPFEGHAALLRHGLHRLQLALGQRIGLVQQPPDQGGLAVVDMADDGEL
jgi:hypothetical protein